MAGEKVDVKPGNAMPLRSVPVGTIIHNIEMKPGKGARWPVRPAPTPAGRSRSGLRPDRLGSGELRMAWTAAWPRWARFQPRPHEQNLGKAGRVRHMGWRRTFAACMNPIATRTVVVKAEDSWRSHPVRRGARTPGQPDPQEQGTDKYISVPPR